MLVVGFLTGQTWLLGNGFVPTCRTQKLSQSKPRSLMLALKVVAGCRNKQLYSEAASLQNQVCQGARNRWPKVSVTVVFHGLHF